MQGIGAQALTMLNSRTLGSADWSRRIGTAVSRYTLPFLIGCCFGLVLGLAMAPKARQSIMWIGYPNAPRNCTEARAMGLHDIPVSSPYYAPWLDGDGDGLGCEPRHGNR